MVAVIKAVHPPLVRVIGALARLDDMKALAALTHLRPLSQRSHPPWPNF